MAFTYTNLQKERELEDLLIDGISGGAVGGKLDQKSRVFEVSCSTPYYLLTEKIPLVSFKPKY